MVWKRLRSWDGEDNDSSRIGEGREEKNANIRLEVECINEPEEERSYSIIGGEEKEIEEETYWHNEESSYSLEVQEWIGP